MSEPINGDLSVRCGVDTNSLVWTESPSGTVVRKRVHLVGPPESGQVTSIVRYQPGATFPPHDHPEGEEILVLEGVFSDEHGDWPAGTFLLNPEGFHHAPFSKDGCLLFVKLRQFPGTTRDHIVIDHREMKWEATNVEGVERKLLYEQAGFSDVTCIERWSAAARPSPQGYPQGAEIFVLSGALEDEAGRYSAGTWLRFPAGFKHQPRALEDTTLYVKRGGLPYLRAASR
jgi:anti-sigma factor ChrR (cupin superfamily)